MKKIRFINMHFFNTINYSIKVQTNATMMHRYVLNITTVTVYATFRVNRFFKF